MQVVRPVLDVLGSGAQTERCRDEDGPASTEDEAAGAELGGPPPVDLLQTRRRVRGRQRVGTEAPRVEARGLDPVPLRRTLARHPVGPAPPAQAGPP